MKLVFKRAPRFPIPTDAPRGPSVQPTPAPLKFIRMPGASLIDFLNRIAMTNPPCRFATICDLGQDCGKQPLLASHGKKGPTAQV